LAENAVDNGVELRIRREVTGIESVKDGFQLTVNYWEPQKYYTAAKDIASRKLSLNEMALVGLMPMMGISFCYSAGLLKPSFIPKLAAFVAAFLIIAGICNKYLIPASIYVRPHTPVKTLVLKAGRVEGTGGTKVRVDDMKVGGSGSREIQQGRTMDIETVKAKFIINCAGSYSDKIAKMIGDKSFRIKPRLGDYLLLNRNQGHLTTKTLFPCPDPVLGKGVLVQTTLWGNLILGPTARDMYKPEAANMTPSEIQHYILSKCKKLVPSFDAKETIHAFCGVRAKSDRGDWIIENSSSDGRMIHVAGIDSPGLAGAPAIALEVVKLLEESGCKFKKDPTFNPRRAPIITPKDGMRGLIMGPPGKNDSYDQTNVKNMAKNVICKCEKVTELEVVRALRRSLPIDSTQGIRKRTRAGMGHCQGDPGNYDCEARVKAIIARETGTPMMLIGGRPWPATSTLSQRWPGEEELKDLEVLMNQ
jgi:L-2-hydroxyglutarate oxidase LhgO